MSAKRNSQADFMTALGTIWSSGTASRSPLEALGGVRVWEDREGVRGPTLQGLNKAILVHVKLPAHNLPNPRQRVGQWVRRQVAQAEKDHI